MSIPIVPGNAWLQYRVQIPLDVQLFLPAPNNSFPAYEVVFSNDGPGFFNVQFQEIDPANGSLVQILENVNISNALINQNININICGNFVQLYSTSSNLVTIYFTSNTSHLDNPANLVSTVKPEPEKVGLCRERIINPPLPHVGISSSVDCGCGMSSI